LVVPFTPNKSLAIKNGLLAEAGVIDTVDLLLV
jgi:hypothetical protein